MVRRTELPELLSPAGDMQCLYAAVAAGADAVYLVGKSFGARAFAKNFDREELKRAVSYCHLHGVRLFVTVNTLVYDRELPELSDYLEELWTLGVDAIITADLGVIAEAKRRTPNMEIHASTQMSVHNTEGADAAYSLGCVRAVVARELTLENIKSVVKNSKAEIEVFLHGALCVCYSGQCLMSSLVGGRSGNRGECAQPCRLPYGKGDYPLSLKDLSLARHIEALCDSGVASLKIEGRMKSPEYVYTVTSIYRRLLDERRSAEQAEERELRRVFSRDGFTDGYLVGRTEGKMTGVRSERDKEMSREGTERSFEPKKAKVTARVEIKRDTPAKMELFLGERRACAIGDIPAVAINAPLTKEAVKARLSKMGNTLLSLSEEDIDLSLEDGLNMSPSALNALRREASEKMESFSRAPSGIAPYTKTKSNTVAKKLTSALFLDGEALKGITPDALKPFEAVFLPLWQADGRIGAANGVSVPPVIFDTEWEEVEKMLKKARTDGYEYALVGNLGHIERVRSHGFKIIGDFRLNITNCAARAAYEALGFEDMILSPELTLPMSRDIGGGVIVYGRIPLMLTERCFMRENFGCQNCAHCALTDRTGAKFPMMREYPHRNIILNSAITYMGDKRSELSAAGIRRAHFIFSTETPNEIRDAVTAYERSAPLRCTSPIRRMGKR